MGPCGEEVPIGCRDASPADVAVVLGNPAGDRVPIGATDDEALAAAALFAPLAGARCQKMHCSAAEPGTSPAPGQRTGRAALWTAESRSELHVFLQVCGAMPCQVCGRAACCPCPRTGHTRHWEGSGAYLQVCTNKGGPAPDRHTALAPKQLAYPSLSTCLQVCTATPCPPRRAALVTCRVQAALMSDSADHACLQVSNANSCPACVPTSMLHSPECRFYTSHSALTAPACRCGTPTPGRAWWLPSTCRAPPGPAGGASSSSTTHPHPSSPPACAQQMWMSSGTWLCRSATPCDSHA